MIIDKEPMVRTVAGRAVAQERVRKRSSTPFGGFRAKLSVAVSMPIGEQWLWVNDTPGELAAAIAGDWEHVSADEIGETGGGKTSRFVGADERGNAINAYLMKMPKEWYLQDQKERLEPAQRISDQIKKGKAGIEGLKDGHGNDTSYIPLEGIDLKETS